MKNINQLLINLRNSLNSKQVPENGNRKKVVHIAEKILDFNKQQKDKGINILIPKKCFKNYQ